MHIASVTGVDILLYSFLIVVSAIFSEALVLKTSKSFDDQLNEIVHRQH